MSLSSVRMKITTVHGPRLMIFIKKKKKCQLNASTCSLVSPVTKYPRHFLELNCSPFVVSEIMELPWEIRGFSSCTALGNCKGRKRGSKAAGIDKALAL